MTATPSLHPALQAFLAGFADTPLPPIESMDIATMRQIFDTPLPVEKTEVGSVRDIPVPGAAGDLPARVYQPQAQAERLTVFFHGGGFVMGTLETHDGLCRQLCQELNSTVVSVAYRLAPEHPFPAAPEDAYAVTQWAAAHRAELAHTDSPLLLAGDSAGACLSAAVSLLTKERQGAAIAAQLLFYPTLTPHQDSASYRDFGNGEFFLSRGMMRYYWDSYLPNAGDSANPAAAPLLCTGLRGLPPTHIVTAEFDPLRDDGDVFARQLQAAGVKVSSEVAAGMIHGFMSMPGVGEEVRGILRRIKTKL